jgi:hypothetical protein
MWRNAQSPNPPPKCSNATRHVSAISTTVGGVCKSAPENSPEK